MDWHMMIIEKAFDMLGYHADLSVNDNYVVVVNGISRLGQGKQVKDIHWIRRKRYKSRIFAQMLMHALTGVFEYIFLTTGMSERKEINTEDLFTKKVQGPLPLRMWTLLIVACIGLNSVAIVPISSFRRPDFLLALMGGGIGGRLSIRCGCGPWQLQIGLFFFATLVVIWLTLLGATAITIKY